jgi:hypothetical protein
MALESCAALIRALKARTIYPNGQPVPSDHTPRLRTQWLQMATEFGLQSKPLDPRRDDFGFTTLDEAPAWVEQNGHRIGLHIVGMRQLVLSRSGIIIDNQTLGIIDPVSIGYLIDRRPEWIHPTKWIQSLMEQDNVYVLTHMNPDNPLSRNLREDFKRKMASFGLL